MSAMLTMDLKQVEAVADPARQFRLDVQLALPKWGRACGWSATNDAALLLGVYWCADICILVAAESSFRSEDYLMSCSGLAGMD